MRLIVDMKFGRIAKRWKNWPSRATLSREHLIQWGMDLAIGFQKMAVFNRLGFMFVYRRSWMRSENDWLTKSTALPPALRI
jgi:hypothetical protein